MGGNSGGGGGGSGVVDYPAYMKDWHNMALDDTGVDTLTTSLTAVMDAALGNSPFTGQLAYDPDADITSLIAAPTTLQTLVTLLSTGTTLNTLITNVLADSRIDDSVTEYAADLAARLNAEILPRFEAGMLDINAVVSSAFALGKSNIEVGQDRQVAMYSANLHMKAFGDDAIKVIGLKLEYQKSVSQLLAEAYRIKIVAKKEETDMNIKIDEEDGLWDLEVFQFGANLLASIGGGTVNPGGKGPSTAQSVIGGGMSGAAAGAMIGGSSGKSGWGGAIGGLLGAASGLL